MIDWSSCTDSCHKLQDMQHFMFEQVDLHIFFLLSTDTADSLCKILLFKAPENEHYYNIKHLDNN